jgi:hypothetical protein
VREEALTQRFLEVLDQEFQLRGTDRPFEISKWQLRGEPSYKRRQGSPRKMHVKFQKASCPRICWGELAHEMMTHTYSPWVANPRSLLAARHSRGGGIYIYIHIGGDGCRDYTDDLLS